MTDGERSAPFGVALISQGADKPTIPAVTGRTYGASIVLSAYGGRFDKPLGMWVFPEEKDARDAAAECARLYLLRASRGASA
jgi:hypothetical protein